VPGSSRAAAYDAAGDTVEVLAVFAFGTADPGGAHRFAHAPRFSSGWRGIWLAFEKVMGGLRLAVRTLWRAPGFTAVAVLVIALGVGGSTAVFSVLRGVVLRPLGMPSPEQQAVRRIRGEHRAGAQL